MAGTDNNRTQVVEGVTIKSLALALTDLVETPSFMSVGSTGIVLCVFKKKKKKEKKNMDKWENYF